MIQKICSKKQRREKLETEVLDLKQDQLNESHRRRRSQSCKKPAVTLQMQGVERTGMLQSMFDVFKTTAFQHTAISQKKRFVEERNLSLIRCRRKCGGPTEAILFNRRVSACCPQSLIVDFAIPTDVRMKAAG